MTSYEQMNEERYSLLISRYQQFVKNLDNPNEKPIRVFDPLTKKQIEELELIREVSLDLHKKKEEDKAAQLAKLNAGEEEEAANKVKKEDAVEVEAEEKTE